MEDIRQWKCIRTIAIEDTGQKSITYDTNFSNLPNNTTVKSSRKHKDKKGALENVSTIVAFAHGGPSMYSATQFLKCA